MGSRARDPARRTALGGRLDHPGIGGQPVALERHSVAALLNAYSTGVAYDLNGAEVIALFNAAWDGTEEEIEDLKNVLAGCNEQGCPIN